MSNRYWVGGTGNWSDYTNHWSASSGGSPGASLPTSSDDVFIDANSGFGSGGTITLNVSASINDFTCTSGHNFTVAPGFKKSFTCYGSLTLESGMTFNNSVFFNATTIGKTITTAGVTINGYVKFNGIGGGWTLQDNLFCTGGWSITHGTFDANDYDITVDGVSIEAYSNDITVNMGSGTWELTEAGRIWSLQQFSNSIVNLNAETSIIKINNSSASNKEFYFFDDTTNEIGKTYNNIWFTGLGPFSITGSNTFNDLKIDNPPNTIKFAEGTTTTVNTFTVSGTAGNLITIDSVDGATQHTLSKSSGIVICDYLDINNSNAVGGAAWYAGSHSANTTNNDGWLFEDAPAPEVPTAQKNNNFNFLSLNRL